MNIRMKIILTIIAFALLLTGVSSLSAFGTTSELPMLEDIIFTDNQDREEIVFQLNGTYIPKTFAIKGKKPRVVFDFYGVGQAFSVPNTIETDGKYVERIRIGRHEGESPKTRVVFDLVPGKKIRFNQDFDQNRNRLTISILPATKQEAKAASGVSVMEQSSQAPHKVNQPEPPSSKQPQKKKTLDTQHPQPLAMTKPAGHGRKHSATETVSQPEKKEIDTKRQLPAEIKTSAAPVTAPEALSPSSATLKPAVLQSVVFVNSSSRGEMVQFSLSDFHPPKVFGIEEGVPRVVCDFPTTKVSKKLPREIKVNGRWVKTIRIGSHNNPDRVRVVIDLAPNNNYDLQQVFFTEENLFVIIVNTVVNPQPAAPVQAIKKNH